MIVLGVMTEMWLQSSQHLTIATAVATKLLLWNLMMLSNTHCKYKINYSFLWGLRDSIFLGTGSHEISKTFTLSMSK